MLAQSNKLANVAASLPRRRRFHSSSLASAADLLISKSRTVSSNLSAKQFRRDLSIFRPVYELKNNCRPPNDFPGIVSKRWANTSSGYYAPSTMTSSQRARGHDIRDNLSVFEDSEHLPSLPVPRLEDTIEKLKETIWPVAMNSAEFANTLRLVDKFSGSAGQKLDTLLCLKASQTKNWIAHDWWVTEAYLRSRRPLVINSNPSMIYPTFPFEVNNQRTLVNTVAQLISGVIDFKLALIHGYNPEATGPENEFRLDPNLCYDQYKYMFGSTRVPGENQDTIKRGTIKKENLEQEPFSIVISYKGRFFEAQLRDIEDEKGRIENIANILDKIIVSIKDDVDTMESIGAGVLTTMSRDQWASAYKLLDGDSIKSVEDSEFVVCLDTLPETPDNFTAPLVESQIGSPEHYAALGRQILHGDKTNVSNRWFDKAIQLIVVADHKAERLLGAGINYEHSFGEGVIATKLIEHSYDKAIQKNRDLSNDNFFAKQHIQSQKPALFRQLKMFDENNIGLIGEHLCQAKRDFSSQVDQFDLSYMSYKNYGSNAIKSWRFSPDSWFQVALQAAFHNLHKRLGPCYESASTRRFAYGRTETIRSLTKDVAQFCLEPSFETMQAAIHSHKSYAIAANNGSAIDRVLMAYRMIFNELKSNSWPWGLPTETGSTEILKLSARKSAESSDATARQNFSVEDLFSESELRTIGSFFNNELINRSSRYALSTSQVSSVHPDIYMGYGPLVADGYGCCYNITGQQIVGSITANSSNDSFSCEVNKLNESLSQSLDRMKDIVEEQRSKS